MPTKELPLQSVEAKDLNGDQNWLHRLLRVLAFVDLPIRHKFLLLAAGTLFWFLALALVAVGALTLLHYQFHKVAQGLLPHQQAATQVLEQLQGLERELVALPSPDGALDPVAAQAVRERLQVVRGIQTGLNLQATQGDGTLVEDIVRALAADATQHADYIQNSLAAMGQIEQALNRLPTVPQESAALASQMQALEAALANAKALTQQHAQSMQGAYQQAQENIVEVIRYAVHTVMLLLVLASALLLLFIYWIITAFQQPIGAMIRQIDSLSAGEFDSAQKVSIKSLDEIGDLSKKFNALVERVYGMTIYKKVIEEDASLEDVYRRMGQMFERELGSGQYTLYEVNEPKREMAVVYPPLVGDEHMHCEPDILSDCTQCRAAKTGHRVSSFEFPGVCRRYAGPQGMGHVCIPLLTGGHTSGVVQLRFPMGAQGAALEPEMPQKLFNVGTYIEQSVSVIEAKRLMQTLRESATIDPLTGLYNRRFLQEHTQQLISGVLRRKSQIGLLLCDLDYFKQVNDTYGHDAGDLLLKEVSIILRSSVRESDVVIRFGGEEFLVLLLDTEAGRAQQVAEKIRLAVEKMRVNINGETLSKTISVGVAEFPGDTDGFWQAIKYADVALYQAKEQGRNRVLRFAPEMWTQGQF
ncbi:GGDEF domain-containing protein [Serpentinimonas barnesii]|uniref:GGDEF domain-containing protein n=1 Tax=Serpentinimonas barnesii TaxID=1458427 RepID=UPI0011EA6537|nr:GGDEF domain-containing protein [Serpentinimonas barnesii]